MLCEVYLKKPVGFFIIDFSMMEELKHFFSLHISHFCLFYCKWLIHVLCSVVLFLLLLKFTRVYMDKCFLSTLFSAGKYCRWHASSQSEKASSEAADT